jgi:hypothetical protein
VRSTAARGWWMVPCNWRIEAEKLEGKKTGLKILDPPFFRKLKNCGSSRHSWQGVSHLDFRNSCLSWDGLNLRHWIHNMGHSFRIQPIDVCPNHLTSRFCGPF